MFVKRAFGQGVSPATQNFIQERSAARGERQTFINWKLAYCEEVLVRISLPPLPIYSEY